MVVKILSECAEKEEEMDEESDPSVGTEGRYQNTRVADPDPNPDLNLFGRIREIFAGSESYRYFGNVKLYKQGKNILKIGVLYLFR